MRQHIKMRQHSYLLSMARENGSEMQTMAPIALQNTESPLPIIDSFFFGERPVCFCLIHIIPWKKIYIFDWYVSSLWMPIECRKILARKPMKLIVQQPSGKYKMNKKKHAHIRVSSSNNNNNHLSAGMEAKRLNQINSTGINCICAQNSCNMNHKQWAHTELSTSKWFCYYFFVASFAWMLCCRVIMWLQRPYHIHCNFEEKTKRLRNEKKWWNTEVESLDWWIDFAALKQTIFDRLIKKRAALTLLLGDLVPKWMLLFVFFIHFPFIWSTANDIVHHLSFFFVLFSALEIKKDRQKRNVASK